jgi:hypothetical protein
MFTGNFIDGLIAAVERAEKRAQGVEVMHIDQIEPHIEPHIEPWIASAQQNPAGDSIQLLWHESGVA